MAKTGRKPILKDPKQTFVAMERSKFLKLEKIAQDRGTSINDLIRRAVDEKYFAQPGAEARPA